MAVAESGAPQSRVTDRSRPAAGENRGAVDAPADTGLDAPVSNPESAGRAWESLLQEVVSRLRRDQRGKLHGRDGVAGALAAKEDVVREGQEELQE